MIKTSSAQLIVKNKPRTFYYTIFVFVETLKDKKLIYVKTEMQH